MKARVCDVADRGAKRVDYELKCTESWFGSLPMGLFNKEAGQESSHGVNLDKGDSLAAPFCSPGEQ